MRKSPSFGYDKKKTSETIIGNGERNSKVNKKHSNAIRTKDDYWQGVRALKLLVLKDTLEKS